MNGSPPARNGGGISRRIWVTYRPLRQLVLFYQQYQLYETPKRWVGICECGRRFIRKEQHDLYHQFFSHTC